MLILQYNYPCYSSLNKDEDKEILTDDATLEGLVESLDSTEYKKIEADFEQLIDTSKESSNNVLIFKPLPATSAKRTLMDLVFVESGGEEVYECPGQVSSLGQRVVFLNELNFLSSVVV